MIMVYSFPTNSFAKSFDSLPISKSSDQWSIKIDHPDKDEPNQPTLTKAKKGVFNVYSLDIRNIGDKDINNVKVEAYRDEPNSTTKYELFTHSASMLIKGNYRHSNFPISVKSKDLVIDITWEKTIKESYVRHYKETFTFHQK